MPVWKRAMELYTATLITAKAVIPAKAGIQKKTGFRIKPGMTNRIRLMSSYKAGKIHRITDKLPRKEDFGLTSQIRDSSLRTYGGN